MVTGMIRKYHQIGISNNISYQRQRIASNQLKWLYLRFIKKVRPSNSVANRTTNGKSIIQNLSKNSPFSPIFR